MARWPALADGGASPGRSAHPDLRPRLPPLPRARRIIMLYLRRQSDQMDLLAEAGLQRRPADSFVFSAIARDQLMASPFKLRSTGSPASKCPSFCRTSRKWSITSPSFVRE
jgi:hypothetical protein